MADIEVANTDSDLSGNTLVTEENAYTITGLHTFSRSTNAPFAVVAGAAVVSNLDADKLDGQTGTYYIDPSNLSSAVGVSKGGTGATSLTDGGVLLGSGTSAVTAMSVLADSEMIVGDGSTDPVAESGATLRTSIGVGTGDSPQFTALNLGHASDTTLTRASSGNVSIEGNAIYRAGGTDVPVTDGGTGVSSLTDGGVLLGSGSSAITPMAVLADSEMIVGDGSGDPVAESGATLRTSVGVGTGDSPQFTGIELGHASDTTLTRASAGNVSIEGNAIYRAGGTDVPVTDGGTGASSLTDGGVLIGSGTSAITATEVLGDGVILIGDASGDPTTLDVGSSTAITVLGTVATGTWQATDVGVEYGGTGASTLASGRVLIGAGTSAITTTGNAEVNGHLNILAENDLRLQDNTGGQYVGLDAPTTVSSSYTLTFPAAIGSVNQLLTINNTDGTLQWATASAGSPGGSDTQVQFNDGGSFGGDSGLTWDDSGKILNVTSTSINVCNLVSSNNTRGPTLDFYHSKASGTDATRVAELVFYSNDDGDTKRQCNRIYFYVTDSNEAQMDSSITFLVMDGVNTPGPAATSGVLTQFGVWTDASDAEDKTWGPVAIKDLFVTDQQSAEDIERGSDGGSVCQRIQRIRDGRYHSVRLPEGKTPVWFGGPSAQDLYTEFGLGFNPFVLKDDGTPKNHIGISPKNQAAISWWAIQELIDENAALTKRITDLEASSG